jgi:peptidylprolyl isomerase
MLAAVLAGCAASPDDASACTPLIAPGDASELVTATGEVGSLPTVDIPAPLVSSSPQRSVLETGSGLVASEGMTVDYDAVLVDGESGAPLQQTSFDGTAHLARTGGEGSMSQAFVCAQSGDRLAVTTTIGDSGLASATATEPDLARTIVLVLDITGVYLGKADGVNQLPQDGMPVVVTAPDGTVGITIPSGIEVPDADRTSTIKLGSGAKLSEGDEAVLQVGVWTWPADGSGATQKSTTWDTAPVAVTLTAGDASALPTPVIDALVGTPVGSQVLVVVAPTGDSPDATVYVVDALGIRPPSDTK